MFVGRDNEAALVGGRLASRRLVTLVGPAGVGKTTLARDVAGAMAGQFELGTRSVDLTSIGDDSNVHRSIAGQLGYPDFPSLIASPLDREVLLLIDNCEHVVDAAADAIDQLLEACEAPTVIATSRRPLDLEEETVVPVGPLAVPLAGRAEADNPCIAIFGGRARDVGADPGPDLELIGEICRRLDGIPLAIELAAARTRSMTPAEILTNLDSQLELLHRPRFRGASRHKSLRAAIGWSYELLDPAEALMLDRTGVMSGTFDIEAAHAICAEPGSAELVTRDLVERLVDSSLIAVDTSGDRAKYRLLESIRAFGLQRLQERDEVDLVSDRSVDHVLHRLAAVMQASRSAWGSSIIADLLDVYPLARDAARWATKNDETPDRSQLIVAVLWGLIHQAHTSEIVELGQATFERWPGFQGDFAADAAATVATGLGQLGELDQAGEMIEMAMPTADRSLFAPVSLRRVQAQGAQIRGDSDRAIELFVEGATQARKNGLDAWAIELDIDRASIYSLKGDHQKALDLVSTAIAESEAVGSTLTSLWGASVKAHALAPTDPVAALTIAEEAAETCRQVDYPAGLHACLRAAAVAKLSAGDLSGAAATTLELLDALMINGSIELHMAMGPTVDVLHRAGRTGRTPDIIAGWHELPIMSMVASGVRPPLDGGTALGRSETIRVARNELRAVAGIEPENLMVPDAAASPLAESDRMIQREGDYWSISFQRRNALLKHSKGVADLAELLANPGREIHCLDLMGSGVSQSDLGPTMDSTARHAYEQRVRDLQEEIDEADDNDDVGRADRARQELDAIVDQLVSAFGLGGRDRKAGSDTERARSAVTQRIRGVIRKLETAHPDAAHHLRAAVRTGVYCSYVPEDSIPWQVAASPT